MRLTPGFASTLLLAVSLSTLHGQDTPAVAGHSIDQKPAAKPSLPTGSLTGTVLCADTHRPARGAMIIIGGVPPADGKSNGPSSSSMTRVTMEGTYTAANLEPGEYTVVAILPGYLSPLDDILVESLSGDPGPAHRREVMAKLGIAVVHSGTSSTFDVTLERGAAISGQVTYSDGSPATQIHIDLEDVNAKPLKSSAEDQARGALVRQLFTQQSQSTDDQGHFRISGIKPGSYRIAAVQSAPTNDPSEGGIGGLMGLSSGAGALHIYSGDTLHKKSAKVYDLRSADEVPGIDITIPLTIFHQVHGTLAAKDGRPVNTASLTLTDTADESFKFSTTVATDGGFTFPTVPTGTYTLVSTKASIIERTGNAAQENMPIKYAPHHTTAAFADATTTLIVKDSNLDDVSLPLTEVPIPPNADKPPSPDSDDN